MRNIFTFVCFCCFRGFFFRPANFQMWVSFLIPCTVYQYFRFDWLVNIALPATFVMFCTIFNFPFGSVWFLSFIGFVDHCRVTYNIVVVVVISAKLLWDPLRHISFIYLPTLKIRISLKNLCFPLQWRWNEIHKSKNNSMDLPSRSTKKKIAILHMCG